ncbi:TPA: hypothetical protein ENS27_02080 [bacterium]|nr:hypothetical protein [bacterium]
MATDQKQLELLLSDDQRKLEQSHNSDEIIHLNLTLTGNPWTDMGIVSLCQELQRGSLSFLAKPIVWTEHEVIISIYNDKDSLKEMEAWFYDMLRGQWNEIFWLSKPAKVLNRDHVFKDGFIDETAQFPLTREQWGENKDKLKGSFKDSVAISQTRLNYLGTKSDRKNVQKQLENIVKSFIKESLNLKGAKNCDLCGNLSDDLKNATQSINPLFNKHHNTKVREFASGNTYYQTCPICYLTNLCTALNKDIPFVYSNKQTSLILPDIPDLQLLRKVLAKFERNLHDLSRSDELYTSTNLRGYWWHDVYSLVLVLFHNIFYEFSIQEDKEEWSWNPVADKTQIPLLNRWLIIPFTKPQNVRFGNIHVVEVDNRLYDFIKPIPLNDGMELRLVLDILSRMKPKSNRPDGILVIRHLCQAIATSDTALLNTALFELYKHSDAITFIPQAGRPHPVRLLPQFVYYFLEVNEMLDKELRDDLRAFGTSVGLAFSHDVTLISKLYNISNESDFRSILNQIMFRLYKLSTSGKATQGGKFMVESQGESREITPLRQERVTNILDQLSEENWKEMAETLSTFACLSAFNANFFKSTT